MKILNNYLITKLDKSTKPDEVNEGQTVDTNSSLMNIVDKYDESSMYILKEISSTENDYKLTKRSFVEKMLQLINNVYYEVVSIKIYKVEKRDNDVANEQKSDNILLLHDTSYENALGILEKRFKSPTN